MEIKTSSVASDSDQMYTAGYLEGYLTQSLIADAMSNLIPSAVTDRTSGAGGPSSVREWFKQYDQHLAASVATGQAQSDPYWIHVGLVRQQMIGLWHGYNAQCLAQPGACPGGKLDWLGIVEFTPDAMDVGQAVTPAAQRTDWLSLTPARAAALAAADTHCSALVVGSNDSDVLMGHTTWGMYSMMLRVAKSITTELSAANTSSQRIVYSSYPGYLYSGDDW